MKRFIHTINMKCLLTASVLSLLLFSCHDDILEEKPLDFLSPENAYSSEEGVMQGITGLLEAVRNTYYTYYSFQTAGWSGRGSDEMFLGENPGHYARYLNDYSTFNSEHPVTVAHWKAGYKIIQMANMLIKSVEGVDEGIFNNGEAGKNMYLAEARFIRAFEYRWLVSTYGDIPLLIEPVESAKNDFVRDPIASIHQQMEEDFSFAAIHLPRPGEEDAPGRLTQGPAWHYLAETYLEMGDPQAAVEAATHVVDDYNYALMTERFGNRLDNDVFGSGDVYYDLFGFSNHNLSTNTEAMFVIQSEPLVTGGARIGSAYFYGPRYFDLALTPDGFKATLGTLYEGNYTGYNDTLSRPTAMFRGTNYIHFDIWQSDWYNDIRNAEHSIKRHFYYDNPESAYHGKEMDFSLYADRPNPMIDTCKILYPAFIKFFDPLNYYEQLHRAGSGITHKDWYALRFAETLLLRAEAYLGINSPDLAAEDINKIRDRANATPVAAGDVDIHYILDERARELYGEEWRLIILRRTNTLIERVQKYNDNPVFPQLNIQEHNFRWPIPLEMIDLNTGAEFPQNPGYL